MKRSDLFLFATLLFGIYVVLALAGAPQQRSVHADLLEATEPGLCGPSVEDADALFSGSRSL